MNSVLAYCAKLSLIFVVGSLTNPHYVQKILLPVLVPFLNSKRQPPFQQDNARLHIVAVSIACMQHVDNLSQLTVAPQLHDNCF
ncbi:hypothetical protein TNCT_308111 [Trichonephila clavata]|uniref:Uncharacterized protein n=1 Tax=Trichonephila clavata TaxID=2740835 RepID=A0A8X6KLE6_TRICU|nr:hypothetical protein TNCT_308111 [Trichonephila clavata]